MLIAMAVSLVFTFSYATLAAKSARAGMLLIPLLDILQSVPILGFISITTVFFLSLAPGRIVGAEMACVFALFTSQAWNMAFSFYQSLRTVPVELIEAGQVFRLNGWARFWRIEVPFAMPPLIWNMMMSMSGGWFFVVASEAISVGKINIALPGIGSYIALAIANRNLSAVFWAIGAMLIVILIYDQLMFRPLVAWASRFRIDQEQSNEQPESWMLMVIRRARLFDMAAAPMHRVMQWTYILERAHRAPSRDGEPDGEPARKSFLEFHRLRAGRLFAVADGIFVQRRDTLPLTETLKALGPGPHLAAARAGADCARKCDLDADRRAHRSESRGSRPSRSRSRNSWPRSRPTFCFPWRFTSS